MSEQLASRDTTFDGVGCKSMWLDFSNMQKDNYLTVSLKIDGKEKVINEFYIPGLYRSEGITLHGHNLAWVFNNRNEQIAKLKTENAALNEIKRTLIRRVELLEVQNSKITKLTRKLEIYKAACEFYANEMSWFSGDADYKSSEQLIVDDDLERLKPNFYKTAGAKARQAIQEAEGVG